MESDHSSRLHGLDHLRALAIVLVFFYHYRIPIYGHPAWLDDAVKFGWTGVDLFFVLSGFLISSQLFAQIQRGATISFKDFFLKRVFRIIPAFLLVVSIYFLWDGFHEREALLPLWRYLMFTQNFDLDLVRFGTFSHAWSLCVEEHFYFFLPLTLIALQFTKRLKHSYWILIVLFIFGLILRHSIWMNAYLPNIDQPSAGITWYKYIYYPTYCRLVGLLIGVSIAAMYQFLPSLWKKISQFGNIVFVAGIVVLIGAYYICFDEHSYLASVIGFPLVSIGYGLLVMSAISPTSFLYKWRSRATALVATLSYAIYLSHKGIIHVTQNLLQGAIDPESNKMLLMCAAACILAALLLNIIIERPFLRLRTIVVKRTTE